MQMQPLLNGKCIEEPLFNSIDHVYLIWGQLIISQSTFVAASAMLIFCLGYIVVSKAPIMILSNLCSRLNVLSLFKKKKIGRYQRVKVARLPYQQLRYGWSEISGDFFVPAGKHYF